MQSCKKFDSLDLKAITQYLTRLLNGQQEEEQEKAAKDKMKAILSDKNANADSVKAVKCFMETSPSNRQKLISYCIDFIDPTHKPQTVTQNGEEVMLNTYLREDELEKLNKFVERHKNDMSFGEVVYMIMEKHKMTPPQVYKNALLRRQDFSRVTNPKCTNITRRMAWQIIIGLHCTLDEADIVLFSAGYVRRNSKLDLTMQYFIEHGNYDIEAIDFVLEDLNLKTFTY